MSSQNLQEVAQFLTFSVAGEEYAIDILKIREILEFGALTVIPKTPAWLRGVINLRGSVVPVVDLSTRLGRGETVPTRRTCVVIVEATVNDARLIVGVVTESVNQVVDLSPEMIEPPPAFGTLIDTSYLLGVTRSADKFAMLLDIDRLLTTADAITTDELEALASGTEPPVVVNTPAGEAASA